MYIYRRHYTEGAPFESGLRPRQKNTSLTPTPSPTHTSSLAAVPVPYSYNMHDPTTTTDATGGVGAEGKDEEDAGARSDVSNKSERSITADAAADNGNTHSKFSSPKRHKHSTKGSRRKSSAHSRK